MPKLGSKERPIIVRVQTEEALAHVAQLCDQRGWHYIAGLEPDKTENLADLEKMMKPKKKRLKRARPQ